MEEKDLNFNYSECIKSYDSWNKTTYVNICNGHKETVPWGIDGYLLFFGIIILMLIGITIIAFFIRMMFDF